MRKYVEEDEHERITGAPCVHSWDVYLWQLDCGSPEDFKGVRVGLYASVQPEKGAVQPVRTTRVLQAHLPVCPS